MPRSLARQRRQETQLRHPASASAAKHRDADRETHSLALSPSDSLAWAGMLNRVCVGRIARQASLDKRQPGIRPRPIDQAGP